MLTQFFHIETKMLLTKKKELLFAKKVLEKLFNQFFSYSCNKICCWRTFYEDFHRLLRHRKKSLNGYANERIDG